MENWNPANDEALRPKEVEVHEVLHQKRAAKVDVQSLLKNRRLKLIPRLEAVAGSRIRGKVLDIGCGSGFTSAWLALNREVDQVYALEATKNAVENLIPKVLTETKVPDGKVIPTLGSFNAIPREDFFDFIVSFGAIHHSATLLSTLRECAKSLRPGGFMFCQEPVSPDWVSNQAFWNYYEAEETFHGMETIKKGDRDDHFFRGCEYKTAFHFAGLEVIAFRSCLGTLQPLYTRAGLRKQLQIFAGRRRPFPPPKPYMMVLRKPEHPPKYIPHLWVDLKTEEG